MQPTHACRRLNAAPETAGVGRLGSTAAPAPPRCATDRRHCCHARWGRRRRCHWRLAGGPPDADLAAGTPGSGPRSQHPRCAGLRGRKRRRARRLAWQRSRGRGGWKTRPPAGTAWGCGWVGGGQKLGGWLGGRLAGRLASRLALTDLQQLSCRRLRLGMALAASAACRAGSSPQASRSRPGGNGACAPPLGSSALPALSPPGGYSRAAGRVTGGCPRSPAPLRWQPGGPAAASPQAQGQQAAAA